MSATTPTRGAAVMATLTSPNGGGVTSNRGGLSFDLVLDAAKSPAKPVPSSPMTTSVTTLEDVTSKLEAAEARRKKAIEELRQKLEQAEKHAQEVREKKEQLASGAPEKAREEIAAKLEAAEARRKRAEEELRQKLEQAESHAQEVREKKELNKSHQETNGVAKGKENGH